MDITFRALLHTNVCNRKTMKKSDISSAMGQTDMLDFLIDIDLGKKSGTWFPDLTESQRQNILSCKVTQKIPETNKLMKHPLYSSNPNQTGQKQIAPRQITQQKSMVDPMDIDNNERQSTMSYGLCSHQNKN